MSKIQEKKTFFFFTKSGTFLNIFFSLKKCYFLTLPSQFADSVDLKDGLLNNRVCTVKFPVVESSFSCNTIHTELHFLKALCKDGLGHQPGWTWRFCDSDFIRWCFTAKVLLFRSPS